MEGGGLAEAAGTSPPAFLPSSRQAGEVGASGASGAIPTSFLGHQVGQVGHIN